MDNIGCAVCKLATAMEERRGENQRQRRPGGIICTWTTQHLRLGLPGEMEELE